MSNEATGNYVHVLSISGGDSRSCSRSIRQLPAEAPTRAGGQACRTSSGGRIVKRAWGASSPVRLCRLAVSPRFASDSCHTVMATLTCGPFSHPRHGCVGSLVRRRGSGVRRTPVNNIQCFVRFMDWSQCAVSLLFFFFF